MPASQISPTVIELFAGAGLLGEAFRNAGCVLEHAYDADPTAVTSYHINHQRPVTCCDLTTTEPTGSCDILLAGPPCQGFSTLGKRDPNDPRNRLSLVVADWACALRPSIVVVENVAAFAGSPAWRSLTQRLRQCGYEVSHGIFDAASYGAAQRRLRSFTVAALTFVPHINPRRRASRTVREAWLNLPEPRTQDPMSYAPKPSDLALRRFKATPPGGDKRTILAAAPELAPPSWWKSRSSVTDVWGRIHWDEPSNTIRTAFQNPSKGRYVHPDQHRVITLREGARLQGIPDSWTFAGSPTQIARQIGNGVPIPLGRAIARSICTMLN